MTNRTKGQTTQWPTGQKDRQHNGQQDKRTDNTMVNRTKGQTTIYKTLDVTLKIK